MPIYSYPCPKCGERIWLDHPIRDESLSWEICDHCEEEWQAFIDEQERQEIEERNELLRDYAEKELID